MTNNTCGYKTDGERCGEPATYPRGSSWYCVRHHRHYKMRMVAKERGLYVPTPRQLDLLTPPDMVCHECGDAMVWAVRAGEPRADVASLQHYDDGTLAIIHLGCNVAHKNRKAGRPEHQPIADGMKFCSGCDQVLPASRFCRNLSRKDGLSSRCRDCRFVRGNSRYVADYVAGGENA